MYRFHPLGQHRRFILLVVLLVLIGRPAVAQTLWAPAVDLYLAPQPPGSVLGSVGQPSIGMDQSGNAIAVWSDWLNGTNSVVRAARFDVGTQTWSAASPLSPSGQTATEARVAVAPGGDAVAIWQGSVGVRAVMQTARYTASSSSWGPVTILSGATDDDVLAEIDVDGAGNAVAVWVRRSEGFRVHVSHYTVSGNSWSLPVAISASGVEAFYPHVAIDGGGNAIAIWASTVSASQAVIKAARYSATTTAWAPPADISPDNLFAYWPDLAIDTAGNAVAVWTYGDRLTSGSVVQSALYSAASGSWNAAVPLSEVAAATANPHVAVDDSGVATAVWQVDTGVTTLVQAARYSGGAWGTAQDLAQPAVTGAGEPRVALDGQGRAVATWRELASGSVNRIRAAFFDPASGAWSSGATLSPASDAQSEFPNVAVGANRQAVVVWRTALSTMDHAKAAHATLPDITMQLAPVVSFPDVMLGWTPPASGPAPTLYTVVASLSSAGVPVAALPAGTATALSVIAPAGTYFVRVLASVGGDIVPSNQVVVNVTVGPVPTAPLNLNASVSGSIVTLSWNPPANAGVAPVRSYVIEAGSTPGASDLANFSTGNANALYVATVPDGNYYVRARASRVAGTGPATPDVRVIVGPPPPTAPTLGGTGSAGGAVMLSWTAPTGGSPVTGYQLQAGTQPGLSDAAVFNVPASQLGYAAAGVPSGTYYVRVIGLSVQGPGESSNELTLVVP